MNDTPDLGNDAAEDAGRHLQHTASSASITAPGVTSRTRAYIPDHTPASLKDFAAKQNWASLLCSGSVFIHDKRPKADCLISLLTDVTGLRLREERLEAIDVDPYIRRVSAGPANRYARAMLLDGDLSSAKLAILLASYRAARRHREGLWVRGHVDELSSRVLAMFDVIFAFDMASTHMDKVRSVVAITDTVSSSLADYANGHGAVAVALTIEPGEPRRDFPTLFPNPVVLPLDEAKSNHIVYMPG